MIFIDTDVLAIELIHKKDARYSQNSQFLQRVKENDKLVTSIFNVLELCTAASHNLPTSEIDKIFYNLHFATSWIQVLYPSFNNNTAQEWFSIFFIRDTLQKIKQKMRYPDAVILVTAESHGTSRFVTWNKKDFEGRTSLPVLNPSDYLKEAPP